MNLYVDKGALPALATVTSLSCFVAVAAFRASFAGIDGAINAWATTVNTGWFLEPALLISRVLQPMVLFAAVVALAGAFLLKQKWRLSVFCVAAMAGQFFLVDSIKALTTSPRPVNSLTPTTDFSFPSGHATAMTVFALLLVYLSWQQWRSIKVKASFAALAVFLAALMALDRVYLNVHWFSDVLGAVLLGAFWFTLCLLPYNRGNSSKPAPLNKQGS